MVGWVFPAGLTASLAWKCPPVPGNSIQMFNAQAGGAVGELRSQGQEAEPAFTPSQGNQPYKPVQSP